MLEELQVVILALHHACLESPDGWATPIDVSLYCGLTPRRISVLLDRLNDMGQVESFYPKTPDREERRQRWRPTEPLGH